MQAAGSQAGCMQGNPCFGGAMQQPANTFFAEIEATVESDEEGDSDKEEV